MLVYKKGFEFAKANTKKYKYYWNKRLFSYNSIFISFSTVFFPLSNRHPINHNLADDILTQTWFIVMLGSIIAIIIFSFVAMVLIKRIQFIKQTSLTNIHGMLYCIVRLI